MANWTARLRRTTRSMAESSTLSRRSVIVDRHFEAAAVLDMEAAGCNIEDALVVRRQHDGALGTHGKILQLVDHQAAGDAIEGRRRLVGDDQVGQTDHDAGNGDTLLLAAGEFVRPGIRL